MGSDKSNPNDLDIYGEPIRNTAECFNCGVIYKVESSSAPIDYVETYCSMECYEADTKQMQREIAADRKLDERRIDKSLIDKEREAEDKALDREFKIGDFRIKVRKE